MCEKVENMLKRLRMMDVGGLPGDGRIGDPGQLAAAGDIAANGLLSGGCDG